MHLCFSLFYSYEATELFLLEYFHSLSVLMDFCFSWSIELIRWQLINFLFTKYSDSLCNFPFNFGTLFNGAIHIWLYLKLSQLQSEDFGIKKSTCMTFITILIEFLWLWLFWLFIPVLIWLIRLSLALFKINSFSLAHFFNEQNIRLNCVSFLLLFIVHAN